MGQTGRITTSTSDQRRARLDGALKVNRHTEPNIVDSPPSPKIDADPPRRPFDGPLAHGDWPADLIAARVAKSCAEQGVPVTITDPLTIAKVATLLGVAPVRSR